MRVHVLIENASCHSDLVAEHGLSLLIETAAGLRILFDAGATAAFADNAQHMGVDLASVDVAVLSHGHFDHGGGLARFLELNHHAPIWVSPHAFDAHYNANGKNIGLSPELRLHPQIHMLHAEQLELAPGVQLHRASNMPTPHGAEGQGMTTVINGERVADAFLHEQYLLIEEVGRQVLFSGCSHRGVLNIASYFHPHVLVGGFHFMKYDAVADAPRLHAAAEHLLNLPTRYYTGHCTGDAALSVLAPLMGARLQAISTGMQINLP